MASVAVERNHMPKPSKTSINSFKKDRITELESVTRTLQEENKKEANKTFYQKMMDLFSDAPLKTSVEEEKEQKEIATLRRRARELEQVDSSWATRCFGRDYARFHAGFTSVEVYAIKKQAKIDRAAKLANPAYLRSRKVLLEKTKNSWTAYFFGEQFAKQREGFRDDEEHAIAQLYVRPESHFFSWLHQSKPVPNKPSATAEKYKRKKM